MVARVLTVFVWILVLTSALVWWPALTGSGMSAPRATPATALPTPDQRSLAPIQRLLGAGETTPVTPSFEASLQLTGVIASPRNHAGGAALISINGKASQPYAIGAPIDGNLVLQSVSARSAHVGPADGSTSIVLELPAANTVTQPPAESAPPPTPASPTTATPGTSIRRATPGEIIAGGRRQRLRGPLNAEPVAP